MNNNPKNNVTNIKIDIPIVNDSNDMLNESDNIETIPYETNKSNIETISFAHSSDDTETIGKEDLSLLQNYNKDIDFDPDENLMEIENKENEKQNLRAKDWEKIEEWLKDLYNGEQVPLYEKNEDTFYALNTMMWKSIEQNSLLKITKGDIRENLKLEYEIKAEKYKKILSSLGISKSNLPLPIKKKLSTMVELVMKYELDNFELGSLQAAICDSNISKFKNKQTIKEQEKQIKELNTQKKSLVYNLKLLKDILTEFESNEEICSQKIEEWISNTQMLDHKEKEYEERILTGKTRINNLVPEESLSLLQFNVLNEIENIIADLNDEIAEKRNKLMSIEDLPSDISLARLKYAEAKQQLEALRKIREEKVKNMALQIF
ncbi:hypothetical protein H8356DRAFT_1298032 [Neocallimastix lanati (nom. inval.)]|jgi:hypothetical protein|uniref:Uncharacterized protein n=1 Tax=Neocallimastix californiae TaxID=1754190 RepID=A0A1Y2D8P1_9FUNG|nr:hypothetical protein H8356DRAFT_1298032 [Neocallimastix sp. JGI-2020a]ORY55587.1 hypothetical protein LY90DRAFT_669615 [Neocallimastix californiae]|eukprot:ORY55587.1 hypothetical protein LY90DRAFT_669615 [Neocallimastix californiae]